MDIFVTGTDTDVGKTVLSALLVTALEAAYWKPIQTGRRGGQTPTDRETVIGWTGIADERAPRELWIFDPPVSPHRAALEAGVSIDLTSVVRPQTRLPLVIEGAGGVLVPINERQFMADLMARLGAPIVVAARTALGTINHTLLTVEAIRQRKLNLIGVVLIGEASRDNHDAIEHYGQIPVVGWIPPLIPISRTTLRKTFDEHFDRSAFGVR